MFQFKRFSIEQDLTPMKVGTDGVLLGAWVSVSGDERSVLDIGTGTGLIAIMLAQRVDNKSVLIDAVEIEEQSSRQAAENMKNSDWASQLNVYNADIKDYTSNVKYDLIVSNPPYFVDSLKSPSAGRTTARHTTELNFADLVASVHRLLDRNGRFGLILPINESQLFDNEARGVLKLVRRCSVSNSLKSLPKRFMSEYVVDDNTDVEQHIELETIAIREGEPLDFSEKYRAITRDFYLKF